MAVKVGAHPETGVHNHVCMQTAAFAAQGTEEVENIRIQADREGD